MEEMHTQGCVVLCVRWRWASTRMKVKRALVSKINRGSFCQVLRCAANLVLPLREGLKDQGRMGYAETR